MSQNVKYKSVSLKVNMKKSVTQKLIAKKVDLIRCKLVTLSKNFDKLEKLLRIPRPTSSEDYQISNEYNSIIKTHKDFCAKLVRSIDVIGKVDKKFNQHLERNDTDTTEISLGVEDLIDKLENGIIHLPPPGVSPVGQ